jgi:Secretion system C-terminal sorting domain
MKNAILLILIIAGYSSFSQEVTSPLLTNPSLYAGHGGEMRMLRTSTGDTISVDSTFTYTYGSLDLTDVWDDFSESKFIKYPANFTDAGVTSVLYHQLMNSANTVDEPASAIYCDTDKARHDSVKIVSGVLDTVVTTLFTPHSIWVNNLNCLPIDGELMDLYDECYVLIDSIIDGVPQIQDTVFYTSNPNYHQDSARVFNAFKNDPNKIWKNNNACHNYRYAVDPWSLGVATFDGVDSTGRPYDFGNENAYGGADTLTSKEINLTGTSNVFLSFLYQAQGHGNMPEEEDSLVVDFWLVDSLQWYNIWYPPVFPAANQWDTAHIAVPPNFLEDGFRFRIRNRASTSGALDHWHIDYVEMEENPILPWEPYKDLAVSMPLNSLLKDYTAAPWDHFSNLATPADAMIDTAFLKVYNSDNTPTNVGSTSMFLKVDYDGANELNYQLPNPGTIPPWTSNWELGVNEFPFFVSPNYTFSAPGNDSIAIFDVTINADADVAASNAHKVNDTTRFQQEFKNFYAYDDGSAEVGYGITGSNSQLAYGFEAYESDTLTGILMHFVPTVVDVSQYIMLLTIWDADSEGNPSTILYQDDYFTPSYPQYGASKNEFKYYEFSNPDYASEIVVPEKFYVGWEQIESQTLNIGMDRNTNSGQEIKFNVGGSWITSSQEGSLMIRPVFSTAINHTLGEREEPNQIISMYPNPTKDIISFSGLSGDYQISVYDMSGRLAISESNSTNLNADFLTNGVYLVNITDASGNTIFSEKLIKQ